MSREDEIKTLAYYLWKEEGGVDGRDFECWLKAEAMWEEIHRIAGNKPANISTAHTVEVEGKTTMANKTSKRLKPGHN